MRTAVNLMSGGMAVGAVANLLSGETSPFGRFSEPGRGGKPVDRTVMWPLMEAPSVVMPLIVWVFLPRRGVGFANKFLLGLFVGHYVHRAIVQPLANRIAGRTPRPIPLHIGLAAFAFALFSLCFLGPRAVQHHDWYRRKFDAYPKDRKALVPFVL
eukprot:Polyplicarium_translucidae@DN2964_c0_g1_i5.p1